MTKPAPSPAPKLATLRTKHLTQLSALLTLPPSIKPTHPAWLHHQAASIPTLSRTLLRPTSPLFRLAMHLPFSIRQATLCTTHQPLNPFLIHSAFLAVTAECTTRLARLVADPGVELPAHVALFARRLQSLSSLWMDAAAYRVAFAVQPHERRHERVQSHCEACVLARIGADEQILCDLRAAMLGRKKKKKKRKPDEGLARLVDAWIAGLDVPSERKALVWEVSEGVGREVRAVRRAAQSVRREERAKRGLRGVGAGAGVGVGVGAKTGVSLRDPDKPIVGDVNLTPKSWNSTESTLVPKFSPDVPRRSSGLLDPDLNINPFADTSTARATRPGSSSASPASPLCSPYAFNCDDEHPLLSHDGQDQGDEAHYEDSIVDYYASLSTTGDRTSIHPAFARKDSETYPPRPSSSIATTSAYRDFVVFDTETGTFARRSRKSRFRNPFADSTSGPDEDVDEDLMPKPLVPTPKKKKKEKTSESGRDRTVYTASVYSLSHDGVGDASQQAAERAIFSGLLRRGTENGAEEQARVYRRLVVEIGGDDMEEDGRDVSRSRISGSLGDAGREEIWEDESVAPTERSRASRSTRWSDFYD